jgi:NADH dehydrogenase [ubiquinone] 1 alpha subcomplex assembly factor 7
LTTLPADRPLLIVANEFLDALPVRQLVRSAAGWRERMVGLEGETLVPVIGARPADFAVPPDFADGPEGAILETSPAVATVMHEVAARLAAQGGAALIIDYGHAEPRLGSTLQAVRAHRKVDVFACPGEADLTAHVDFAALIPIAEAKDARCLGVCNQGDWLRTLGIDARAEALAAAVPASADAIRGAAARLTGADQMGALFKVMGLAARGWPDGAGFG